MPAAADDPLEDLLAAALAAHDDGGEPALLRFLDQHPAQRPALERGLARCRQMGLLGAPAQPAVSPPSTSNASREMPR
ncbi:MAG: hypothetical protein JNL08_17590 [Planctomycetes bacterium]|nr:hypothetical protein [Planctomycetota bacterium]